MKKIFGWGGCLLALLLVTTQLNAQSQDFKAAKSIDLFHSILREVSVFYVDTTRIDKMVNTGIAAMLETLDPYTEFIPEEESEGLELLTTGAYGGIGSFIRKDSIGVMISEPYEDSPAAKAGLMAGDYILEIDGMPVTGFTADECSAKMKGKPGTSVQFKVKKLRTGNIVDLTIQRERIHFSDVAYYGMLKDGIAYIRISGFTQGGGQDLRRAFLELQSRGKMFGLVLDIRGNGGGLLEEAVNMLSLFLPRNSEVVSAKGRYEQMAVTYKTKEEPLDLKIPVVVLVNRGSASSSEILAGAIQDFDRGVIMGTRTFGKGLVQAIRPLNYNAQLKLTTAKYYTPSGRCVQVLDYSHRNEDGSVGNVPDSLIKEFKTRNGRSVYDGGGIMPDVKIESESYSRIAMELMSKDLIRDYAIKYFVNHKELVVPEKFNLSEEEYRDFVSSLSAQNFDNRSATAILLEQATNAAKREDYNEQAMQQLETLKGGIIGSKESNLMRHKEELKAMVEAEICSLYYYQKGRIRSMLRQDAQLEKAVALLTNTPEYDKLLQ